ncbi:uncharacterized protein LOC113492281 [Trichoplusia ni]|uniref:Uncharacterized protein LOC113492281 n=1 Tax=Trichoplusia ni TaxID=7111 RepID=A0A7E5VB60_TRINI|nr:uncharacterized protein LOC113492281 [Trichoplusia ni]
MKEYAVVIAFVIFLADPINSKGAHRSFFKPPRSNQVDEPLTPNDQVDDVYKMLRIFSSTYKLPVYIVSSHIHPKKLKKIREPKLYRNLDEPLKKNLKKRIFYDTKKNLRRTSGKKIFWLANRDLNKRIREVILPGPLIQH